MDPKVAKSYERFKGFSLVNALFGKEFCLGPPVRISKQSEWPLAFVSAPPTQGLSLRRGRGPPQDPPAPSSVTRRYTNRPLNPPGAYWLYMFPSPVNRFGFSSG